MHTDHRPFTLDRRQLLLSAGLAAVALAACGGDGASTTTTTPATDRTAPAGVTSTTCTPTGDGTREVEDVFGPTVLPANPRRVVSLHPGTWGNLLAIGYPIERIVGASFGNIGVEHFHQYAAYGDLTEIEDVTSFDGVPFERIAALTPDLVLSASRGGDGDRADHEALGAGTAGVYYAFNGFLTMEERLRLLAGTADAVNMADAGQRAADALLARIADVSARLQAAGPMPTVGTLHTFGDGKYWTQVSPLLDALGVPGNRATAEEFGTEYSAEQLDVFDDEVLIVFGSATDNPSEHTGDADALQTYMAQNPLWATLPAVRGGRVHFVAKSVWNYSDLPSSHAALDDIEAILLP